MMLSPAYNDLTKLVMPKAKRSHIDSSPAITKYRVIDSNYAVSLVECQPVTGVKHQIRTHLAHALGTPIFGDHKYSHYAKLAPQVRIKSFHSRFSTVLSLFRNYNSLL